MASDVPSTLPSIPLPLPLPIFPSSNMNIPNTNINPSSSSSSFSPPQLSSPSSASHPQLPRRNSVSLGPIFLNHLRNGGILLKHGNSSGYLSRSNYRFVWLSSDLKFFQWGDLKSRKVHGSIPTDTLISIGSGPSAAVKPKHSNTNCSFCLQFTSRTLDLECPTESDKDLWIKSLEYLMFNLHAKREKEGKMSILENSGSMGGNNNNGYNTSTGSVSNLFGAQSTTSSFSQSHHSNNINNIIHNAYPSSMSPQLSSPSHSSQVANGLISPGHPTIPVDNNGTFSHFSSMTSSPSNANNTAGVGPSSLVQALEMLSQQIDNAQSNGNNNNFALSSPSNATSSHSSAVPPSLHHARSVSQSFPFPFPTDSSAHPQLTNQTVSNLYGWLDESQNRIEQLEKENELWREDNRKLVVSYTRKMIKLQETIDMLRREFFRLTGDSETMKEKEKRAMVEREKEENKIQQQKQQEKERGGAANSL